MRTIAFSILGLLLLASIGCNSEKTDVATAEAPDARPTAAQPLGAVAVIDLDDIARRLGRDVAMEKAVKQQESALNQQLQTVQASYNQQINEKQREFGDSLNDEDAKLLLTMKQRANLNLNDARRRAQSELTQHRFKLISLFREEIKPVARDVAKSKGLSIIVTRNDTVIYAYDTAVDITDEVFEKVLARQPKPAPVAAERVAREPAPAPR
jgi:Skp family chaperone for outer membrane proteins